MRWHPTHPNDDGTGASDASRPWWDEPDAAAGAPSQEPGFDAILDGALHAPTSGPVPLSRPQDPAAPAPARRTVLGGLPRSFEPPVREAVSPSMPPVREALPPSMPPSVPPSFAPVAATVTSPVTLPDAYVPVFAAAIADPAQHDAEDDGVEPEHGEPHEPVAGYADPEAGVEPAPYPQSEESPVFVGTDEGTLVDDVVSQPAASTTYADSAAAEAPQPGPDEPSAAHEDDVDDVPVPVAELAVGFGERIERLIAAAVAEAENTRTDAQTEATHLVQAAQLEAEHTVAAAHRQATEIVASTQRRCDDELAAAQRGRQEAEQVLADARQEADQTRRRVRNEVTELRAEIDQHAQTMLARTHADTTRMLASARAELDEITTRKAEQEAQLSAIRSLLTDAVVAPLPQEVSGFLDVAAPDGQDSVEQAPAGAADGGAGESAPDAAPASTAPVEPTAPNQPEPHTEVQPARHAEEQPAPHTEEQPSEA